MRTKKTLILSNSEGIELPLILFSDSGKLYELLVTILHNTLEYNVFSFLEGRINFSQLSNKQILTTADPKIDDSHMSLYFRINASLTEITKQILFIKFECRYKQDLYRQFDFASIDALCKMEKLLCNPSK